MKILQLTDTHIKKYANTLLYGVDVRNKFERVISHISLHNFQFDCFLLTGDIADDGSSEAYEYVANSLANFNKKVFYINGNHDNKDVMIKSFSQFPNFEYLNCYSFGNYVIVGIDSCVIGKDYGFIAENEMNRIKQILDKLAFENKKCILVLHHHPVLVNTPLIDDCPLQNSKEFLELINNYKFVNLILSGHVHNEYKLQINENCYFESSLSTFIQFNRGGLLETDMNSDIFGFKILTLQENNYHSEVITI